MTGISPAQSHAPPETREPQRRLAALGAILTCPCHAVGLMFVMSGTALGAFLFRHLTVIMLVLGALFLFSCWLLWQTRDSNRSCPIPDRPDDGHVQG